MTKINSTLPLLKAPLKRMRKEPSAAWSWADVVGQTEEVTQVKFADDRGAGQHHPDSLKLSASTASIQIPSDGVDEIGQSRCVIQASNVDLVQDIPVNKKRGRPRKVDLVVPEAIVPTDEVAEGEGKIVDPLCNEIRSKHKVRQRWHRAEKALTLQARAFCRSLVSEEGDSKRYDDKKLLALRIRQADALYKAVIDGNAEHPQMQEAFAVITPFLQARAIIEASRTVIEKEMEKLAAQLPVAEFVRQTRGIALGGLASIVGETGTLLNYPSVAKVWKRCGVAVMPDGERQRRVAGNDAMDHKYSPSRRSVIWNVGCSLIGGMGKGKRPLVGEDIRGRNDWSPLEKLFVERLRIEAERDESHRRPDTADGKESYSKHAAARAKRYVEKRFLKLLWREWRKMAGQPYGDDYSPAD